MSEKESIQIELLKQENKALRAARGNGKSVPLVSGFYKKGSKTYQFKPGIHLFRLPRVVEIVGDKEIVKTLVDPIGRVISSKALENENIMNHLIKIGFSGIEEA